MRFNRAAFTADLDNLRSSRKSADRAVGDNYFFEENVCDERLNDFENYFPAPANLLYAAIDYFKHSVEGIPRSHIPSTFRAMNRTALLRPTIAKAQKLVRLERIDHAMKMSGKTDFKELEEAYAAKDIAVLGPLLAAMNSYSGARPAFAAPKAEVDHDLQKPDWLSTFRCRAGLGDHSFAPGETGHFVLMEYTVAEVFSQCRLPQPFARPTVLESRNSRYFFPAPQGVNDSYAADLDEHNSRAAVSEILHMRVTYDMKHISKLGSINGPTPGINLKAIRDRHLAELRKRCRYPDYGSFMTAEVDD